MSNEHEEMHDTSQPPFSDNRPEADPAQAEAANQNAPLSQEAVMQAATARIAELEAEASELKDRWMRSEAEIANVRARARREVDETRQYAVQKFATDVVEAAENLQRGLDSLPPPEPNQPEIVAKLREGLEGVERSFLAVLERNGIKREDPTGTPFDPNLHQAMAEQESAAHQPGTVIQAWTKAWTLHGRLLRPAMVVVAKAPAAELAAPPSTGAKPAGAGSEPRAKLDTTA
jgi:molecular chaperone GrpE